MLRHLIPATLCFASIVSANAREYQVYLMAGQSNMEGYGYVNELEPGYADFPGEVRIFHGNTADDDEPRDGRGIWAPLKPGHGTGFKSDGSANELSNRFGPELGFAKTLSAHDPDSPIAIVKYAKGGSSLDALSEEPWGNWFFGYDRSEGVNQWDHCLATIRNAFAARDIDGDGEDDQLVPAGIVWMQGESDGHQIGAAYRYAENLEQLVGLFRAALRDDDLPVVIGRISDSGQDPEDGLVWNFGNVVRHQQAAFCESDANAAFVTSTDGYAYSDKWHYDSDGFVDLGEQFGKAMLELQK
ncbi:sialate O-acetylesterase [Pelagicoccus sp. SDUM812003]|uniref:sialate O-acetylesterase n=1 Tax=Pelagicoccus sp. SDUM812003 TaxID=3041267 RepID=UPI00280C6C5F|nr:sialate O-acetylesterase [Pelagicoccus sp. SDUM812003]MDQ8203536.1 sialate O-acetylesterase [Pelagicoccus sp. SDUM812003]